MLLSGARSATAVTKSRTRPGENAVPYPPHDGATQDSLGNPQRHAGHVLWRKHGQADDARLTAEREEKGRDDKHQAQDDRKSQEKSIEFPSGQSAGGHQRLTTNTGDQPATTSPAVGSNASSYLGNGKGSRSDGRGFHRSTNGRLRDFGGSAEGS
jgi:hypothetical protein